LYAYEEGATLPNGCHNTPNTADSQLIRSLEDLAHVLNLLAGVKAACFRQSEGVIPRGGMGKRKGLID
jgi:hypothetical protein